jgi:hypothetical protein
MQETYASWIVALLIVSRMKRYEIQCQELMQRSAISLMGEYIATGYRLDGREVAVRVPVGVEYFSSP